MNRTGKLDLSASPCGYLMEQDELKFECCQSELMNVQVRVKRGRNFKGFSFHPIKHL